MPRSPRLLRAGWGGARPTAATTPRRRGPHFARAITTRARVGPPRTRGRPGLRRLRPDQSARRHGQIRARQPSPVDSWCGALLVDPGSSHQSGDRAAHMRLGAPEPPAQGPLRDPTPGPDRTPDPRTVSKSATKAVAVPMRRRQNRGITRFRLSHPDRAAAFVADLDNHRPHLGHPQPGRTRDPAAHDPQRARARPTPRTASTCSTQSSGRVARTSTSTSDSGRPAR